MIPPQPVVRYHCEHCGKSFDLFTVAGFNRCVLCGKPVGEPRQKENAAFREAGKEVIEAEFEPIEPKRIEAPKK